MTVDLEPLHPIKSFVYRCDKRFHTGILKTLCVNENEAAYGFVVVDGKGALFGLLRGSGRRTLHQFRVDLPSKTRRGGQSALRFDRLRKEKRDIYIGKVAEQAIDRFLVDNQPKVKGIVVAGSAGCKDELLNHKVFHKRLGPLVIQSLDIAYGGQVGFDAAIDQSAAALGSAKLLQEKVLLERYMEEMSRGTGKYCLSAKDTLAALEMGAVEDLIVWEGLRTMRYEMVDEETGEEKTVLCSEEEEQPREEGCEVTMKELLLDWICDNYKSFGCRLSLVTDRTAPGRQFAQGLGGFGGLLRWRVDFHEFQCEGKGDDDYSFAEDSSSFDDFGGSFDDGEYAF